jgi:GNAT superfamily N-acetyltransferase
MQIRRATIDDAETVAGLASALAQSYPFDREVFDASYPQLVAATDVALLLAVDDAVSIGYVLGFRHLTFYANGPVASVDEILVRGEHRGHGVGRALMAAFEAWARSENCVLIALATRRAAPFYQALGYRESAAYLHKDVRQPSSPLSIA